MENDWLSEISQQCSARETVIVAVRSHRNRRQIADGFRRLGDMVVDWYGDSHGLPFSSLFNLPHRLIVMGYREYKSNETAIMLHLSRADVSFERILIYGRLWRALSTHHSIIDGDRTSPDEICRQYWEARGSPYSPADIGGLI